MAGTPRCTIAGSVVVFEHALWFRALIALGFCRSTSETKTSMCLLDTLAVLYRSGFLFASSPLEPSPHFHDMTLNRIHSWLAVILFL